MAELSSRLTDLSPEKRALLEALLRKKQAAAAASPSGDAAAIPAAIRESGAFPLSFSQERLWFLDRLEPGSSAYNIPSVLRFSGFLEVPVLRAAVSALVRRHEMLRTRFVERDGEPVQIVDPPAEAEVPLADLSGLPEAQREPEAQRLVRDEALLPFDLERGPLLRVVLVRLQPESHLVLSTVHHIASDGWSTAIFSREVGAFYGAIGRGVASGLPELPIQYADYAVWQRRRMAAGAFDRQLAYWRQRLAGLPPMLDLPADRPRPAVRSGRGDVVSFRLSPELSVRLFALARRAETTPFALLLTAFLVLLRRCTGSDDIAVGTPVAGRRRLETEGLIGFFVNTLVMRGDFAGAAGAEGDPPFSEALARMRDAALEADENQEAPFERLVAELAPDRAAGHAPLFQVMFVLQNLPPRQLDMTGVRIERLDPPANTAKVDLSLALAGSADDLSGEFEYSTDLFDAPSVQRLAAHFTALLAGIAGIAGIPESPERNLSSLPLLAESERAQLLTEWGEGPAALRERRLSELFADWEERSPEATAVVGEETSLTYAELGRRARRLASHLRGLGVGPEVVVGLSTGRRPEMAVGLLAVLEAGGAYLPLDPAYPRERLGFLLEDSRAVLLLADEASLAAFPDLSVPVVRVEGWERGEEPPRPPPASPAHLAYVIYTSGSTGTPKGVLVSHRGIANLAAGLRQGLGIEPGDRILQFSSASFDASVWDVATSLLAGAELHLAPPDRLLPGDGLVALLRERRITHALLPPSALAVLPTMELPDLPHLRGLAVGGEACLPEVARRWREGRLLLNAYGPTEATVCATLQEVTGLEDRLPIGRPIPGAQARVLDRFGAPAPIHVPGELFLGGPGLARGYLGRPELTAERFVPDPWSPDGSGGRLYRTGDLVRWLPDGRLDFLGRVDRQVKVRGFRIEPAEIEAALLTHPDVRTASVVVGERGAGERRLIAWIVPREGVAVSGLRAFLRERLPEHLVPAVFAVLSSLPVSASGKVDRQALARFEPGRGGEPDEARTPPRGPVEELLAEVWSELLGLEVERIGAGDGFFDLGGHSLLATRLSSRVRSVFGVDLPLRAVFEAPELGALAARIEEAGAEDAPAAPPIVPVPRGRDLPLSFAQERLWFLDRLQPGLAVYNVPLALAVRGTLRAPLLAAVLGEVVRRHESLRTTFAERDGVPVQVIAMPDAAGAVAVAEVDLAGLGPAVRAAEVGRLAAEEAQRPFDLACGPLLRCALLRLTPAGTPEEESAVLLTLHHIVSDLWSMDVLVSELAAFYPALAAGLPVPPLPPLPVQYADFATWQRGWLQGEALEAQLRFWRERLASAPEAVELPADRPRPASPSGRGGFQALHLGAAPAAAVSALARRAGGTLFMALLAGWQALLVRMTGAADLPVGVPVANRARPEVEGLIGFFTNTLVLRGDAGGNPAFLELAARVRETALAAYAHQDLPFEKLVEELAPERSLSRTPLFQVMFAMQEGPQAAGSRREMPGLTLSALPAEGRAAKFDLTLFASRSGEGLTFGLEHSADRFDPPTAARLLEHFAALLGEAAAAPERPILSLSMLREGERHQLLAEWGAGGPADEDIPVHRRFAAQAAATPERPAVAWADGELSYAEVEQRAGRLARRLLDLGLSPEDRVAVCLERGWETGVALLAVLEAGGCYLPLDPSYPPERLGFMLENAGAAMLIAQPGTAAALPEHRARTVMLDGEWWTGAGVAPPRLPDVGPDRLAYLTYTSGSTGRPKGVAVPHRVLSNLAAWHLATSLLPAGAAARTLQLTSVSFDVSLQEVFATWGAGGTLVVATEEQRRDPERLLALLRGARIERLFLPYVALQQLAEAFALDGGDPPPLLEVQTAGEQLRITPEIAALFRRLPECGFHNHYGPSETHLLTSWTLLGEPGSWPALPPVGRPISGVAIRLVDRSFEPAPAGVPGELYAGGTILARGYLGRPADTAERFLPDPWAEEPGARLYRTGDLARFRPSGEIEFLGRADGQVKIRGFRIEPGEIETVLAAHPAVREAVVGVQGMEETGTGAVRRLVAFVLPASPAPEAGELRSYLQQRLPDYMVPAAFVTVAAFPLTPSGKVDRRRLAAEHLPSQETGEGFVAPRTRVERELAGIWSGLLGGVPVGARDNFFELGGHSLLATRVLARVRNALGAELPLRALFESPVLERFAAAVEAVGAGTASILAVTPAVRSGPVPLSFSQQRLWFLDRLEPGGSTYNLPVGLRLSGALDVTALAASLSEIVRRHESLRTRFTALGGEPAQVIDPPGAFPLPRADLRGLPATLREAEARRLAGQEAQRPFDLQRGPVLRALLLALGESDHLLLAAMHHIVSDGWSLGLFSRELGTLYGAFTRGLPSPLPELPIQYADFALWQRRRLEAGAVERDLAYWRERLAGLPPVLELPADRPRPAVPTRRGSTVPVELPADLAAGLAALARHEGATLFMALLAGFQALLGRWAGVEDLAVGTPVAGRQPLETEGLIGLFLETLVLRADLRGDPSFRDLLARTRDEVLGAQGHAEAPFERLVAELTTERSLAHSPLFQVMLTLQNAPSQPLELPGLRIEPAGSALPISKVDLHLALGESGGRLLGDLEHSVDLFDLPSIQRLAGHLQTFLEAAAAGPDRCLSELPLLTPAEAHQLRTEWNDTGARFPQALCLHELFEIQAGRTPEAPAVLSETGRLTYRELDERSSRLAERLREMGAGPDRVVGVSLERSADLVVALLAVLRAGGAYLPLDPAAPPERRAAMLEDSGATLLLGRIPRAGREDGAEWDLVRPAERLAAPSGAHTKERSGVERDPTPPRPEADNLAYVLFTSGSTGRPKGVMNTHRAIVNRLLWMQEAFCLTPADRVLQKTPAGFDVSVWEFFWPLITGAALVVARPGGHQEPRYLAELIQTESVTTVHFVPSMLQLFAEEPLARRCTSLTRVIASGEALPADLVRRLAERLPAPLYNLYGPTEAAVDVTWWPCDPADRRPAVPIGRPIANLRIHLLDRGQRPVPIGAAGELLIGGVGLARGYASRPDLTAERFVPDPFAGEPGGRLYRTGDLARHRPDGAVEFLGRIDHQVKVRGVRIELGEIEAALAAHPGIREAVVAARTEPSGDVRLAAYLVAADGPAPEPDALRAFLRARLPEPMVPSAFVSLTALPLNANGKVDRKALPAPGLAPAADAGGALLPGEGGAARTPPRTPAEESVAAIWREVLGRPEVGIEDDFFDIGGHSLLAIQAQVRIESAFGIELPLREVFRRPTLAGLAAFAEERRAAELASRVVDLSADKRALLEELLRARRGAPPPAPDRIPAVSRAGGHYPLSFSQQRLWFLAQLDPESPAYHLPAALRLTGSLDRAAFGNALDEVVARHGALRTTFDLPPDEPGGEPAQRLTPPFPRPLVTLPWIDLDMLPETLREAEVQRIAAGAAVRPFDLRRGPMVRGALLRLGQSEHVALITVHHIVADGWSMGLLVRDMAAAYRAFTAGRPSPLQPLALQYADYAVWLRGWLTGEVLEKQLAYWRKRLAGAPAALELPADRPRPPVPSGRGAVRPVRLSPAASAALGPLGRREGATLFMVLLAAWNVLLHRYTGEADLVVGSPVANRNRAELEGLIGFFANTVVLRSDLSGQPTFLELLARVREATVADLASRDLPFERLVEELAPERSLARSPLFQVLFSLQNVPLQQEEMPGLTLAPLTLGGTSARFDLALGLSEGGGRISGGLELSLDLFDPATIDRMAGHLAVLADSIAADPGQRIGDLPLLDSAERQALVVESGSGLAAGLDCGLLVPERLAAVAARRPDAVALVFEEERIPYRELHARANRLAHRLRRLGVGPEVRAGVCLERGPDLLIALLAVLKAGGAYVPLDPSHPRERLDWALEDAGIAVLLTSSPLRPMLSPAPAVTVLEIDRFDGAEPDSDLGPLAGPEDLAYLIYTSGSTGRPKGVEVRHRGLLNLLDSMAAQPGMGEGDALLAVTTVSFDIAALELFLPLLVGARVELAGHEEAADGARLAARLASSGITVLQATPATWRLLIESGWEGTPGLKVLCGGEALPAGLAGELLGRSRSLWNVYGPTETTIWSTVHAVRKGEDRPLVPVGRPVAETAVYLLDPASSGRLDPVPLGVAGELCIGGSGLARGYRGRPELTAERFVPDPYGGRAGARLYRTGDLARRLPRTGDVEFLGRLDHQVKVRGFRIELGEIESVLGAHPAVRQAVVLAAGEESARRLVACVVAREETPAPAAAELRDFLKERLPDYMVPASWVVLPELPLTPNGKVDRRALASLAARQGSEEAGRSAAPRTPAEELLAGLWAEVLGRDRIGIEESFFDLGGHSLLAARLASRVRTAFGVELPLRALFEEPTVAGLARRIEAARRAGMAAAPPVVPVPREVGERLPLSFSQERLWFLDRLQPDSPTYNMPLALRARGDLSVPVLAAVLGEVVRRQEALRTTFPERGGSPVQVVAPASVPDLPVIDLSALGEAARAVEERFWTAAHASRPFDLDRGPLLRCALLRLSPGEEHTLLFNIHHIVSDLWSMGVLTAEVAALYPALAAGRPSPLPPLPVQYADFAVWQRGWLQGDALEAQLRYWRGHLAGAPAALELPSERPRPALASGLGGWRPAVFAQGAVAGELAALGRRAGATPFMLLLAAWTALLHRYSGQDDVVVGTPIANRNRLETEGLIGFFLNTLALRSDLRSARLEGTAFSGLLARVRETTLDAFAHQDLPFEKLVEELAPERSLAHSPLFQVLFVLQNNPAAVLDVPGLTLASVPMEGRTAKFDLTLSIAEAGDALVGGLEHSADLFDPATVDRMAGHFANLLSGIAAEPSRPLADLPLLGEAEHRQILEEWGLGGPACSEDLFVHRLFQEQARRTPERAAVIAPDESLTYAEVDRRAAVLSRHLEALGVGPDVPVAVCLERGWEMGVALLAVLEAGGCFLPLDPAYPAERLAFMLEDSGAAVLITTVGLHGRMGTGPAPTFVLIDEQPWEREGAPSPARSAGEGRGRVFLTSHHLAYLIYTSGSTGRPKGVALPHRVLSNLIAWQLGDSVLPPGSAARTLQFASPSFDASVHEVFATWGAGGTLVVATEAHRKDPELLLGHLRTSRIDRLFLPYVALQQLAEAFAAAAPEDGGEPLALREVQTAGEQLRITPEIAALFRRLPGCVLHNHYGPSETHVITARTLGGDPGDWPALPPIGRPLAGTSIRILDRALQPVPAGVPGELHAGGVMLARGYLGRPDQTAERFHPDPWSGAPGGRLYRTGDLARFRASGEIEFLGRIDGQVKIRGFRVEPGEIEAVLTAHPGVREAVVGVQGEGGGRRLAAYVLLDVPSPSTAELRAYLRERLPDYMVPAVFLPVAAFPLTPSGKVDRRGLAALAVHEGEDGQEETAAPRTPVEEILAGMWEELLGNGPFRAGDDFFDRGGHSLLATRAVSRVREAFGIELPLRTLFESPTLSGFAAAVEAVLRDGQGLGELPPPVLPLPPSSRDPQQGELPLSFAQERLWFLDRMDPGSAAYNMPFAVRLTGRLDRAALAAALAGIAARHESLRTTFAPSPRQPGKAVQRIAPPPASLPPLPLIDLAGLALRAEGESRRLAAEEAARPFDLERGPMLRSALLRLPGEDGEEHLALFALHHIVADGWSMGVLVRELGALYAAITGGRRADLPPLPVQYPDFAVWQRGWLQGDALAAQLGYWRGRLAGAPALDLLTDRPRPPVRAQRGTAIPWSSAARDGVAALSRSAGATPFMTLLAAFTAVLGRWAGQSDVSIGSAVAGRNRAETEGLIGFFVNTLVLRLDLSGDPTGAALVRRARETALGAFAHQDLPFEMVVEELQPERDLSRTPLFQVMLALQNTPGAALDLSSDSPLILRPAAVPVRTAKFDLTLFVAESATGLDGAFELDTDLFDRTTIARLGAQLARLLEGMAAEPAAPVSALPLLSAAEAHQVRTEWNDTARPEPRFAGLHELFAEQAARAPEAPALSFGGRVTTYGELERRAGRLASHLRGLGIGTREDAVAICADRSPELVIAALAVLQAGGAYVPLDPYLPAERFAYIVEDSRAVLVLAQERWMERLEGIGAPVLPLEALAEDGDAVAPAAAGVPPGRLAQILYTSGSTGRPKGVAIPHRAILLHASHTGRIALNASDRIAHVANPGFDASTFEIWGALLHGGCLVAFEREELLAPSVLAARLAAERITVALFTPALFHQMAREVPAAFGGLRYLLAGGESADPRWVRKVMETAPPAHFLHLYGPTEAAVYVTSHEARQVPAGALSLPIGRPNEHVRIHLLDRGLRPVPIGVAGDLFIGAPVLARGYVGRPETTAESFVPDPWGTGERLYRTGDRARFLAGGEIEFLGRLDHQVKIRGFRIELGEIEAALGELPGVAAAAAGVRTEGAEKKLAAWVAGVPGSGSPDPAELRRALERKLPPYMVPAAVSVLPALPLNPSGKLDRLALSRMSLGGGAEAGSGAAFAPPSTPVEEVLAGIWSEVLGLDPAHRRIGVNDNFFDLSGHSLLATQVASRVHEAFGVELPLRRLFERATLGELAREIEAAASSSEGQAGELAPIELAPRDRPIPAAFYQEWGYAVEKVTRMSISIPFALRLHGRIDFTALRRGINEIVRRHESLRTTFREEDGAVYQVVGPPFELALPEIDLSALPAPRRDETVLALDAEHAHRWFDLDNGPLVSLQLLRLGPDEHGLLCNFHHFTSDGWSMQVFLRELTALYPAFAAGRPSPLVQLPRQFADFAWWQRRVFEEKGLPAQLAWWRQHLAGRPAQVPEIPADRPRPAALGPRGVGSTLVLEAERTRGLRRLAQARGCSLATVLAAAIQALMYRYTGEEDQLLNAIFSARNRPELAGIIGFVMNTVVVRTDLSGQPTFGDLLVRARDSLLAAYAHQETPFPRLLRELFPDQLPDRSLFSRVQLNLLSFSQGLPQMPSSEEMPAVAPVRISLDLTPEVEVVKQDLLFACREDGEIVTCRVLGAAVLFEPESVAAIAGDLGELLAQVVDDPEVPVRDLLPAPRLLARVGALAGV